MSRLISEIESGLIAVPSFQREYVWVKEQVIEFFDSIANGYPIGSVLLWKSDNSIRGTRDILTDEISHDNTAPIYIIDGRQRLTTFYGCVTNSGDKDPRFRLCYNLETNEFEYPRKESLLKVPLWILFDTFTLLSRLQEIHEKFPDKARTYVESAKHMNSILQEYSIARDEIENCSLDDACKVFARINEKGTEISKTHMLQALGYKTGEPLLGSQIDEIRYAMAGYGFDRLSQDDVLNCFFRFAGQKNFFDSFTGNELEKLNLKSHFDEVMRACVAAARFLYHECRLPGVELLPYKKQFIALTWFFGEIDQPSDDQLAVLRKWYYLSSWDFSFQNSSLSNIRKQFKSVERIISGKDPYHDVTSDNLDKRISLEYNSRFHLSNSRTKILVQALRAHQDIAPGETMVTSARFRGETLPFGFVVRSSDRQSFQSLLKGELQSDELYDRYLLTPEIIRTLNCSDLETAARLRIPLLRSMERRLLLRIIGKSAL